MGAEGKVRFQGKIGKIFNWNNDWMNDDDSDINHDALGDRYTKML